MSFACSSKLGSVKKPFIGTGEEATPAWEVDSFGHTNAQWHRKNRCWNSQLRIQLKEQCWHGPKPVTRTPLSYSQSFSLHLTSTHLVCPVKCFGARTSRWFKPRKTSASSRRVPPPWIFSCFSHFIAFICFHMMQGPGTPWVTHMHRAARAARAWNRCDRRCCDWRRQCGAEAWALIGWKLLSQT